MDKPKGTYKERHRAENIVYQKAYYAANKERLLGLMKVKVVCDCGATHNYGNTLKHSLSKKHLKNMELNKANVD